MGFLTRHSLLRFGPSASSSAATGPGGPERPARVPAPWRLYAIGDVHGRADLLERLFLKIDADALRHPDRRILPVLLGDYIDRGPSSREVIELLVQRGRERELVCLKGNHEDCALQALASPEKLGRWLRLGALPTLTSYGVSFDRRAPDFDDVMSRFDEALPASHRRFLEDLPTRHDCGDYFFSHAGLRPGVPLDAQSDHDLMWVRGDFLDSRANHERIVVHGHTPGPRPEIRPNRINVDTGAYMSNRLTCLVLDGAERSFIDTL